MEQQYTGVSCYWWLCNYAQSSTISFSVGRSTWRSQDEWHPLPGLEDELGQPPPAFVDHAAVALQRFKALYTDSSS